MNAKKAAEKIQDRGFLIGDNCCVEQVTAIIQQAIDDSVPETINNYLKKHKNLNSRLSLKNNRIIFFYPCLGWTQALYLLL